MLKKTSSPDIQNYLTDASNLAGGYAEGVVFPENEKEIVEFVREANAKGSPITVAGKGTGLTGARVPMGGWVMATDALNCVKNITPLNSQKPPSIILEPGVSIRALQDALNAQQLFYPPEPTSFKSFIGGNVSTNASGARSFKYGVTRDFVKRIRGVLSTGDIFDITRGQCIARNGFLEIPAGNKKIKVPIPHYAMPTIKNTAGYYASPEMDAVDLFIGSEGTLAIYSEIELSVIPLFQKMVSFVIFFPSEEGCWKFADQVREKSKKNQAMQNDAAIQACSLEYLDGPSLDLIRTQFTEIPAGARAALFIEQECQEETEQMLLEQWFILMENHHLTASDCWMAGNEEEHQRMRTFRHEVPLKIKELLVTFGQSKIGTDIAVPPQHFVELMQYQRKRVEQMGMLHATFGHIGDAHVHLNILPRNDEEHSQAWAFYQELMKKALSLGGTIAAEHGIGKIKVPYLKDMYGDRGVQEMAAAKKALDPKGILGQGNMFSKDRLSQ